jgi:hypothetical protein
MIPRRLAGWLAACSLAPLGKFKSNYFSLPIKSAWRYELQLESNTNQTAENRPQDIRINVFVVIIVIITTSQTLYHPALTQPSR